MSAPYSRSYKLVSQLGDDQLPQIWFPCGVFADKDFAIDGLLWTDSASPFFDYQAFTTSRLLMEGPVGNLLPRYHAQMGCRLIGQLGSDMLGDGSFRNKLEKTEAEVRGLSANIPPYPRATA